MVDYASNEEGQLEVYVRPFPNVNDGTFQISREGGDLPVWGRDSQELFYLTRDGPDAPTTLMGVAIETAPTFNASIPHRMFEGPYQFSFGSFDVSSDGERFLMVKLAAVPLTLHLCLNRQV